MQYHRNRGCPICELSNQNHGPERSRSRQRLHDHGQGGIKQRALISRRLTWHFPNVAIDVEVRIIHPDGTAAAWRDLDQPLAQPWQRSDPARD